MTVFFLIMIVLKLLIRFFFKLYKDEYKKIQLPIYISLILYSQNKNKYLSKNNFNYNNFNFIKNLFPNSFFLTPFRKPLDQANSLLNQHKNFLKIHNEEKFTQRYMSYLGHEEFGKNHKPWHKPINFFDNLNINYWLEQWLLFYDFILNEYKNEENLILLSYENLNNELILEQLSKKISIKSKINFSHINYSRVKVFDNYDDDLLNKCDNLYNKLLIESINV